MLRRVERLSNSRIQIRKVNVEDDDDDDDDDDVVKGMQLSTQLTFETSTWATTRAEEVA